MKHGWGLQIPLQNSIAFIGVDLASSSLGIPLGNASGLRFQRLLADWAFVSSHVLYSSSNADNFKIEF
jgi:hypothetical protein